MTDAGTSQRVSDLEREVSLLKNRMKKAESFDGSRLVRSGNSRVSVTLYGQVNRAVRFAFTEEDTQVSNVDQDGSGSRLGFLARGRVDEDLTISARTEVEWQYNRRSGTQDNGRTTPNPDLRVDKGDSTERLRARHVDLWTDHRDLGQLWLGKGSIASDAATLISMSGTSYVFAFHGPGVDDAVRASQDGEANKAPRHGFAAFTGQRQSRIMYATPNVMGFRALVSHSEKDRVAAGLRYAGSPFGMKDIRAAMRFGWYRQAGPGATHDGQGDAPGVTVPDPKPNDPTNRTRVGSRPGTQHYGLSGGIMHVPTGFSLSGSWGRTEWGKDPTPDNHMDDRSPEMFAGEVGWTGSVWDMGTTSVSLGYGRWTGAGDDKGHSERVHTAVVQRIVPAATDIYLGVSYDTGKDKMKKDRDAVVIVLTGIRLRF